jgi:parallel beta-helix repeat protein
MKKRTLSVLLFTIMYVGFCSLIVDRTISRADVAKPPGVIYSGKYVVDLFVSDCGVGIKCEVYRDGTMIEERENLPTGVLYLSNSVSENNIYDYTVKRYNYNDDTKSWDYASDSDNTEVDSFYVQGTIHNGAEWLQRLDRDEVSWDDSDKPYYCKRVTIADGQLEILKGAEVVFLEQGDYLTGNVYAQDVTFKRDIDTFSPLVTISGGILKDCVFQEGVDVRIEGDGGKYTGNVFREDINFRTDIVVIGQNHIFQNNILGPNTDIALSGTENCTVTANKVHDIRLGTNNSLIQGNTCNYIGLSYGETNIILENTIGSEIGINLSAHNNQILSNVMIGKLGRRAGVIVEGNGNTIKDNLIQNGSIGVDIYGPSAHGNTIENNRIEDCSRYGIQLKFGPYENLVKKNNIARSGYCGIYLQDASANRIENNSLDTNGIDDSKPDYLGDGGIHLTSYGGYPYQEKEGSIENIIAYNTIWGSNTGITVVRDLTRNTGIHENIIENNDLGIDLAGSGGIVYNNIFRGNKQNARGSATPENGIDNQWNHSKAAINQNIVGGPFLGGNYWGDYTGVDTDFDEIGDSFYPINDADGNPVAYDELPLKPVSHYADISVDPTIHHFGTTEIGLSSVAKVFTIANKGTSDLKACASLTGTNAAEFAIAGDACSGNIITPSKTSTIEIVFAPAMEGEKEAILRISSNDIDKSPLNIPLSGKGSHPLPGDVNLDWNVHLSDAVITLKVNAGFNQNTINLKGDTNGDSTLDILDDIYILQKASNLKQ